MGGGRGGRVEEHGCVGVHVGRGKQLRVAAADFDVWYMAGIGVRFLEPIDVGHTVAYQFVDVVLDDLLTLSFHKNQLNGLRCRLLQSCTVPTMTHTQ